MRASDAIWCLYAPFTYFNQLTDCERCWTLGMNTPWLENNGFRNKNYLSYGLQNVCGDLPHQTKDYDTPQVAPLPSRDWSLSAIAAESW